MDKNNKKIEDNKRMIKEEKKKIKSLKRDIRNIKKNKFKKTKFGKFLKRSTGFFSDERNTYSFSEVFVITLISSTSLISPGFTISNIAATAAHKVTAAKMIHKSKFLIFFVFSILVLLF